MFASFKQRGRWARAAVLATLPGLGITTAHASNHLDTPTVIANPQADIGDIYAWTAPDGRHLNLVMTIVGHSFSDKLRYSFFVDSGRRFGQTTATTPIVCRFHGPKDVDCQVGDVDAATGDASAPGGLMSRGHRFRVFAGLRDDPFFNNVKGTREAYKAAGDALRHGAPLDEAGCASFDPATTQAIHYQWRHTDEAPATNFLAGWAASALVISVDLEVVSAGGRMLAVWATTASGERQLDRVGRPLTANALLGQLAPDEVGDALKEQYNTLTPATSTQFIPEIEKALAFYDSFDGKCGNQLLAVRGNTTPDRYRPLATLLADDRLWVNSASRACTQFFAVELASLAGQAALAADCGGRTPLYDAANIWRSLLVDGTRTSIDDGLSRDEREHSAAVFPFLGPPDPPKPTSAAAGYKE